MQPAGNNSRAAANRTNVRYDLHHHVGGCHKTPADHTRRSRLGLQYTGYSTKMSSGLSPQQGFFPLLMCVFLSHKAYNSHEPSIVHFSRTPRYSSSYRRASAEEAESLRCLQGTSSSSMGSAQMIPREPVRRSLWRENLVAIVCRTLGSERTNTQRSIRSFLV